MTSDKIGNFAFLFLLHSLTCIFDRTSRIEQKRFNEFRKNFYLNIERKEEIC